MHMCVCVCVVALFSSLIYFCSHYMNAQNIFMSVYLRRWEHWGRESKHNFWARLYLRGQWNVTFWISYIYCNHKLIAYDDSGTESSQKLPSSRCRSRIRKHCPLLLNNLLKRDCGRWVSCSYNCVESSNPTRIWWILPI